MGKLSGITVVDLTQFLPGPMLSVMMADQGARVIKIEPPAGDPAREQAPFEGGHSVWFSQLNRGKESRVLDLKSDAGKAALRELIAGADVFLEGFRPGVMARLGFDYASVRAINPRVVYCSISAFGQTGELAHHPAHDLAVQALAGFLSVNDGPDGTPVVPGAASARHGRRADRAGGRADGLDRSRAERRGRLPRYRDVRQPAAVVRAYRRQCDRGRRIAAFGAAAIARRGGVLPGLCHEGRAPRRAWWARAQVRAQPARRRSGGST